MYVYVINIFDGLGSSTVYLFFFKCIIIKFIDLEMFSYTFIQSVSRL